MFYVYNRDGMPIIFKNELVGQASHLIEIAESFDEAQQICDDFILPQEVEK